MRMALPIFAGEVAPRFCSAGEVLLIEAASGGWRCERRPLAGASPAERLRLLATWGVGVLLCNGFNRHLLPQAESLGIEVIWSLSGSAETLIAQWLPRLTGTLERKCR